MQALERRHQLLMNSNCASYLHGGWECVVRTLPVVDIIIWMQWVFRADRLTAHDAGGVGDHLIDVHVGARAGTSLIDIDRKVPHHLRAAIRKVFKQTLA